MRVPVSWLRDFVETDADAAAFADALTARGLAVEAIERQPTPQLIVVGRIEKLERHPNADKLLVSIVDVGSAKLQIVTGATNVAIGHKVPIALVGATVFERAAVAGGGERPTKAIRAGSFRGVDSAGMMCSASELALPGEFDDGIVIMEDEARVGADFWETARFGDAVLDVDVPSNRPDCFSMLGIAAETAAALGVRFAEPRYEEAAGSRASPVGVAIGDASVCRRLLGQYFWSLRNHASPMWMKLRLHAAGVRSLNLLVDISNYVQLETGQPLHVYDAAHIRGAMITARAAHAGEKVITLDGVERVLEAGMPVIADGAGPVGIAGIMGGAGAAVGDGTTELFLESPNFVGAAVRRAALRLGLRTEGSIRHEKNLPLELPEIGRRCAAQLLARFGGQPSAVVEAGERSGPHRHIDVRIERVNHVLGTSLGAETIVSELEPVGLSAEIRDGDLLRVSIPFWRTDLAQEVDLIEEVARLAGYDNIAERPTVASPQKVDESLFDQESLLADKLAALGYSEVATLSLQGSRVVESWEGSGLPYWTDAVPVANPLSDEQRLLRPSLLPGLLDIAAHPEVRRAGTSKLFEIGHIFRTLPPDNVVARIHSRENSRDNSGAYDENGVLEWPSLCALSIFDEESGIDAPLDRRLLEVKGDVEAALALLTDERGDVVQHEHPYLHPGASANIAIGGRHVAKFGRLHPRLARAYELPASSYAFFLFLEALPKGRPVAPFRPLPRFPGTSRDIAVVVDESVTAGELMRAACEAGAPAFESVRAFDEYRGAQIGPGKKSVALTVSLRKADATMTDAQADAAMNVIMSALRAKFGATLRGAQ